MNGIYDPGVQVGASDWTYKCGESSMEMLKLCVHARPPQTERLHRHKREDI